MSPPFLIAAFSVVVVAFLLARWLGGFSIVVAACLWAAIGFGVFHAAGRLSWVDRQPALKNLLEAYAPRLAPLAPRAAASTAAGRAAPPNAPQEPRPAIPDVSKLAGIEDVRQDIDRLVGNKAIFANVNAPATIMFLWGPPGTGKTSMALKMADDLHHGKIVKTNRIVVLSKAALPVLADSYIPEGTWATLDATIERSLDGVLVIDDVDQLLKTSEQFVHQVSSSVVKMANRFPKRMFFIATGSSNALKRVEDQELMTRLKPISVEFHDLTSDALERVFVNLMTAHNLQVSSEARQAVLKSLPVLKKKSDPFENARTIQRLADAVLHHHAIRIGEVPPTAAVQRTMITADDVRRAVPA